MLLAYGSPNSNLVSFYRFPYSKTFYLPYDWEKTSHSPPGNDILISFGRYLAGGKTISLRDDILASLGPYRRRRNTRGTNAARQSTPVAGSGTGGVR